MLNVRERKERDPALFSRWRKEKMYWCRLSRAKPPDVVMLVGRPPSTTVTAQALGSETKAQLGI
jgi:hypothetical protein